MNVFSKPINEVSNHVLIQSSHSSIRPPNTKNNKYSNKGTNIDVVWSDYYKNNIDLKKFKR